MYVLGARRVVRFALNVPNFGAFGDVRATARLAREAEDAGWDGFFVWDHLLYARGEAVPFADPWVLLAAIALATERIRVGPMVTPLARRRPWQVARQATTLDRLSAGRMTLGVGLGAHPELEYEAFGEEDDARTRAEKLDEALEILDGLWRGDPFSFTGRHYRLRDVAFLPVPVQRPRIPVWVGGAWPGERPFRRAIRWDGFVPIRRVDGASAPLRPSDVREIRDAVAARRDAPRPFDIVIAGATPWQDRAAARALVGEHADAGATWWSEEITEARGSVEEIAAFVRSGPPR